jgi:serine O-acetyltransferase
MNPTIPGIDNEHFDFKLMRFLEADLLRAHYLLGGGSISSGRLWLGIFSPRFIPVLLFRLSYSFWLIKISPLAKLFSLINFFLFGIEIGLKCKIGKGLFLPHTQGTVIGAYSIGENATIFQGVTLGAQELDFDFSVHTRPTIGDNVVIGAGAKVLGGITIDSGATISANAVVFTSVPSNVVVGGVPASIIRGVAEIR